MLAALSISLAAAAPVAIIPTNDLYSALRHCNFQASTSPIDSSNDDFAFERVAPGLSGAPNTVSFQSVNYPSKYLCPIPQRGGLLGLGAPGDAAACASPADATWRLVPGLTSPSNFSIVSTSATPAFAGLYVTRNATSACSCCEPGWSDAVLAAAGRGLAQSWIIGEPPPPPPPAPATLVVHAGAGVDHRIKEEFNGCHSDPGYTQETLGWNADLIYGNAFQPSPASKIPAWGDVTDAAVVGGAVLDPAVHVNPNRPVPSLAITYTSGQGIAGWANRGIGNEGFALRGDADYTGFTLVLAPAGCTLYVALRDRDAGETLASAFLPVPASPAWQRVNFTLVPVQGTGCATIAPGSDATIDCGNMGPNPGHACVRCGGEFVVGLGAPGAAHIGFTSLFPGEWGRFAGLPVLRSAMDAMQEMGIKVIRQGGTVSQSFRWKDWRGAPYERASMGHQWGDSLLGSWGMFEFIAMCNAADSE